MLLRALMPHWLQMITFMGLLFHLLKIRESLEFLLSSNVISLLTFGAGGSTSLWQIYNFGVGASVCPILGLRMMSWCLERPRGHNDNKYTFYLPLTDK